MSMPEKSITISILKVYNWNEKEAEDTYEFSFYSVLSKGLILQKIIKPHISNNQLIINTSLKITFTPEQAQVLLKMSKITDDKNSTFINEFLIDLELLDERKIQYLPFDKNDKILEVVNGTHNKEDRRQQKSVTINNKIDKFIQQKSNYLKHMSSQNGSTLWHEQKIQGNHNFTEKLYALLQETRKLREKFQKQKERYTYDHVVQNNQNKNSDQLSHNTDEIGDQRLLVKSSSENLLAVPHNFTAKDTAKKEKELFVIKRWNPITQNRLDLKSLAIINPNSMNKDEIIEDEDEVLRSKQQNFSAFKNNHHQYSAYLPNIHQQS